jgi:hypothetical protein
LVAVSQVVTRSHNVRSAGMKNEPREIKFCDLHEEPQTPAKEELDDDDLYDLLSEAYFVIGKFIERTNPKRLQSDALSLHKRLEVAIAWSTIQ